MIVEAIVALLAALVRGLAALIGVIEIPGWWSDVDDGLDWLVGQAASLSAWFPLADAFRALGFIAAALGAALVIRFIRITASFFTGGGGGAA